MSAPELVKLQPFSGSLCRVTPDTLDDLIERYSDSGYTNQYGDDLIIDLTHISHDREIREEFIQLTGLTDDQVNDYEYIIFYC